MRQATLVEQGLPLQNPSHVPPLKWAGGKRWLRDALGKFYAGQEHRRLVEPFAGGLAITLGLAPAQALVNDINAHLINFYKHLKRGLVLDIDGRNQAAVYYDNRSRFNHLVREGRAVGMHQEGREAAMLFYYLNRHCYNGLCRFNRRGEFNTPFGSYANPKYQVDLTEYQAIIKGWAFTCGDFQDVPKTDSDFIYADPPYDRAFTAYSEGGFDRGEQIRLVKWLSRHKGPVVASNHATKDMIDLYRDHGFDVSRRLDAPRMIHCFGDRTPARELVATKNL